MLNRFYLIIIITIICNIQSTFYGMESLNRSALPEGLLLLLDSQSEEKILVEFFERYHFGGIFLEDPQPGKFYYSFEFIKNFLRRILPDLQDDLFNCLIKVFYFYVFAPINEDRNMLNQISYTLLKRQNINVLSKLRHVCSLALPYDDKSIFSPTHESVLVSRLQNCPNVEAAFEVVARNIDRFAFPLIKYRAGNFSRYSFSLYVARIDCLMKITASVLLERHEEERRVPATPLAPEETGISPDKPSPASADSRPSQLALRPAQLPK